MHGKEDEEEEEAGENTTKQEQNEGGRVQVRKNMNFFNSGRKRIGNIQRRW